MEPTYFNKGWLITEKNYGKSPHRYDVVVVKVDGEKLCKRVIALEGERVKIKNGYIYINGKKRTDPYGSSNITYWTEPEEERAIKQAS